MIIILTGKTCCGKTTAAKYIENTFGFTHIECSTVMESLKHSISTTDPQEVLNKHGWNTVSLYIIDNYVNKDKNYVISGIRTYEELEAFITLGLDLRIIYIYTSSFIAYERSLRRNRIDISTSFKSFYLKKVLQDEILGLARIAQLADMFLVNDFEVIDEYLDNLRNSALSDIILKENERLIRGVKNE